MYKVKKSIPISRTLMVNALDIDITVAVKNKVIANAQKYPIDNKKLKLCRNSM